MKLSSSRGALLRLVAALQVDQIGDLILAAVLDRRLIYLASEKTSHCQLSQFI